MAWKKLTLRRVTFLTNNLLKQAASEHNKTAILQ
jgi:hypothetical protein